MRCIPTLAASFALASAAAAQAQFDFTLDQSQSNFNWSGSSSLGTIVGNPSTAFQMSGSTALHLYPLGVDAIDSGDFANAGDVAVVPDLHGKINNPIPILPPLALIDVTNLHLRFGAPQFGIAANGAFTADVTVTAISGTLKVTPLIGSPSTTDLTGNTSTPQSQAGTLQQSGTNLVLTVPINTTFLFNDPSTGANGSIALVGTVKANWNCPAAQVYCTAKVNSLGCTPAIGVSGTASYTNAAPFTISATNELNQKSGLLFYGFAPSATPFQGGIKCVESPTVRTAIQNSGGSPSGNDCTGLYSYDFNARIQSFVDPLLVPGEEVFAQYWSRDPQSGSTTNLTNAARFTICP